MHSFARHVSCLSESRSIKISRPRSVLYSKRFFSSATDHHSLINVDKKGTYAVVSMNRPKANAINKALLTELRSTVQHLETDPKIRGFILTSQIPGIFSGGLDIPELAELDRTQMEEWWHLFNNTLITLSGSRLLSICAIGGHSPAGGAVLSLTSDYRIMAEGNFSIGLNEVAVNIIMPEGIIALFRNVVGNRNAELYGLTGKMMLSDKAKEIGLVDELVPASAVLETAETKLYNWTKNVTPAVGPTRVNFRKDIVDALERQRTSYLPTFLDYWFHPRTQEGFKHFVENLKSKKH